MNFISLTYLLFIPVVFLLYWIISNKVKWQNFVIVGASWIFYGYADWKLLFLLVGYSLWGFLSGILLERYKTNHYVRNFILIFSTTLFLGILGVYKYFDFFSLNIQRILNLAGLGMSWPALNLVLPIGISFYTFQALGYIIDVYRKNVNPCRQLLPFLSFLSFFPQLVAGPIERANTLLPQFLHSRKFDYHIAVSGMKRTLWGLVKKIVIADNCAMIVNDIFLYHLSLNGADLMIGIIFFTIQIYCDFSGYSDIAIGSGRLFGIKLSENFRYPYFAKNIKDFWRRWHISLNKWFIDYLYIPLGGSRCGLAITIFNTMLVMMLSGLWHGAGFTFMLWGILNGITLSIYILYRHFFSNNKEQKTYTFWKGQIFSIISWLSTITVIIFGWLIFRSPSVENVKLYIERLFTTSWNTTLYSENIFPISIIIIIFFSIEWYGREKECPISTTPKWGVFRWNGARWGYYLLLTIATFMLAGEQSQFVYFQF